MKVRALRYKDMLCNSKLFNRYSSLCDDGLEFLRLYGGCVFDAKSCERGIQISSNKTNINILKRDQIFFETVNDDLEVSDIRFKKFEPGEYVVYNSTTPCNYYITNNENICRVVEQVSEYDFSRSICDLRVELIYSTCNYKFVGEIYSVCSLYFDTVSDDVVKNMRKQTIISINDSDEKDFYLKKLLNIEKKNVNA